MAVIASLLGHIVYGAILGGVTGGLVGKTIEERRVMHERLRMQARQGAAIKGGIYATKVQS